MCALYSHTHPHIHTRILTLVSPVSPQAFQLLSSLSESHSTWHATTSSSSRFWLPLPLSGTAFSYICGSHVALDNCFNMPAKPHKLNNLITNRKMQKAINLLWSLSVVPYGRFSRFAGSSQLQLQLQLEIQRRIWQRVGCHHLSCSKWITFVLFFSNFNFQ